MHGEVHNGNYDRYASIDTLIRAIDFIICIESFEIRLLNSLVFEYLEVDRIVLVEERTSQTCGLCIVLLPLGLHFGGYKTNS